MRRNLFLPEKDKAAVFESYGLVNDQREMVRTAKERVKKILATHRTEPIDTSIAKMMDDVVAAHRH
jgi:trimethylamine:corrinoid methyltransferase-like protein